MGTISSVRSRQANTTKVANAPTAPTMDIHKMCQNNANPMRVAKKAQMNPVALLRGTSMSSYSGSSLNCICSRARCLMPQ